MSEGSAPPADPKRAPEAPAEPAETTATDEPAVATEGAAAEATDEPAAATAADEPAELAATDGPAAFSGGEPNDTLEDIPPDPGSADAASPRLQSIVESLLFAADKPLTLKHLGELMEENELARIRAALAAIEVGCASRGFQLHQVAGGFQFRTNPQNAAWVQKLLAQKPVRLSRAQLETLAIAAYRQPITRPEIDEIRGVDSGGTLKTLLDRALVRILGKKEEPGRPLLYGTTKEFLEFFNLRDLKDLPTLREFHELSEEHRAQVAALEGVAPAGSIEEQGEEVAQEVAPLTRLEITTPPEDERELEEIDRLIRTAGVATDDDRSPDELVAAEEFEREPTRQYDPIEDREADAKTTRVRLSAPAGAPDHDSTKEPEGD